MHLNVNPSEPRGMQLFALPRPPWARPQKKYRQLQIQNETQREFYISKESTAYVRISDTLLIHLRGHPRGWNVMIGVRVTEQLQDFLEKFLMQFLGNLQTPSLCMIMNWTRAGLTTLNISFTLFSRLIVCPWDSKHEAYLDHSAVITWELHLNFITLLSSLYEF